MSNFVPCPVCNRHVLSAETACPFCTAALPESLRLQTPAPRPPGRLSRAALLAAGAALMGAEACSNAVPVYGAPSGLGGNNTATDGGGGAGGADGSPQDGSAVALYGAAPAPLEAAPGDESAAADSTGKS
jgi:hypothetical protein